MSVDIELLQRRNAVAAYFDALELRDALKAFDTMADGSPRKDNRIGLRVSWDWGNGLPQYESVRRAIQTEMLSLFDTALQRAIDNATVRVEASFEEALRGMCGTDSYENAMRSLFGKKLLSQTDGSRG